MHLVWTKPSTLCMPGSHPLLLPFGVSCALIQPTVQLEWAARQHSAEAVSVWPSVPSCTIHFTVIYCTLQHSAAVGVQGQFIGLQVPPSSSSIISQSGWDVRYCLPGSSTNQIGKMRKKFLCIWSAAVELTTTDGPWCVIDTDSVVCTIEDFSVFQSRLRDIIIAPLWQFQLWSLFVRTQIF